MTKSKFKHELELEKMKHQHELVLLEKDMEAKLSESIISKTRDKVLEAPAIQKEINTRTTKSFISKKRR